MKTISIDEFKNLVAHNHWKREQNHEIEDYFQREFEEWNEEDESSDIVCINHYVGFASKTSVSASHGVKIIYKECFSYDESFPYSLIKGTNESWDIEGIVVVDEDGNQTNPLELGYYLDVINADFRSIDYSFFEIEKVTDVDEDSEMLTYTLEIDNEPNVRFTGELLASATSPRNKAIESYYSDQKFCGQKLSDQKLSDQKFIDQKTRWTDIALYKTKGGKFVCHKLVGRTPWYGERDSFSGKVCETISEIKEFFGYSRIAKNLYSNAGIDYVIEVE